MIQVHDEGHCSHITQQRQICNINIFCRVSQLISVILNKFMLTLTDIERYTRYINMFAYGIYLILWRVVGFK